MATSRRRRRRRRHRTRGRGPPRRARWPLRRRRHRPVLFGGGGGGGRIALSVGETIGFESIDPDPAPAAVRARSELQGEQRFGGAGTIFVELVDPASGDPLDDGALTLANPTGAPAAVSPLPSLGDATVLDVDPVTGVLTLEAPSSSGDLTGETLVLEPGDGEPTLLWTITGCDTVVGVSPRQLQLTTDASEDDLANLAALLGGDVVNAHGRSRFASVSASGRTRLVTGDDLEILPSGETTPILNDRAALSLTNGARVLLRGEAPVLSATPSVASGGELRVGQTVSLSWSADDLVGLRWITRHWSPDTTPTTNIFIDERLSAAVNGLPLQVPVNQPAGPVSYVATARDLADRVGTIELTWTVLPNEPPSATLSLADGVPAVLPAGGSTTVVVHAQDAEGLASVGLNATGPSTSPSQLVSTSGTSQDITFTVTARPDATGDDPIVLQAVVTDISGVSVTTSTLELPVTPDTTPPVPAVDLSPALPGDTYTGGDLITLTATATDDVGVTSLSIGLDGQTWNGTSGSLQAQWTAPAVTELTTYTATVEAADAAGNVAAVTRDLMVEPNDNASAPTAEILCPSEGALLPAGWDAFAITAEATDDEGVAKVEFYLGTEVTPFATVIPDSGTPATFTATATAPPLPTDVGEGVTLQYRVRAFDAANNHRDAFTTITVVEAVDLDPVEGYNDWASLADQMVVLRSGTLTLTAPRTVGGLIVLPGAKITHPAATPTVPRAAELNVGSDVYLACGASVDASGRGYAENTTHPGATPPGMSGGGSHLGYGGGSAGSTFGSVSRPHEAGGGGATNGYNSAQPGGGVLRLIVGGNLQCDGVISALGYSASTEASGAGGSIWLTVAGDVSGQGVIEARGGGSSSIYRGAGGGGAIALEYGGILTLPYGSLDASGGATNNLGGAGTIFLKGPDSTFGNLIIDNKGIDGASTALPALGSGVALTGSSGVTLVTDKTSIPTYFVGHWVELSDPDGTLKGTWQIVAIDGSSLTLADGASVAEGDSWQGVYRFDKVTIRASGRLSSSDPIRSATASFEGGSTGDGAAIYSDLDVSGLLEVSGPIRARRITAGSLTVHSGGTLSHPSTSSSVESLTVTVANDLMVEVGGSIDASGRGYPEETTYPGATGPEPNAGGSHLGLGGRSSTGSTYGSVTRPQEPGGGGDLYHGYPDVHGQPGGGVLHLTVGGNLQCDGAIRANGSATARQASGAGGSIWLTVTGSVSGQGVIEAKGGSAPPSSRASGGGGAIALEYGGTLTLAEGSLKVSGGSYSYIGGAGTVFLKRPNSTFGDLIIGPNYYAAIATVLPGLGSGIAQTGSSGTTLVTDKSSIPAYFVGHWVEVSDPDGNLKGTWQVVAIDGSTLTLADAATVAEGDSWQGVYRFDKVTIRANGRLSSSDPIRSASTSLEGSPSGSGDLILLDFDVSGLLEVSGHVSTRNITAGSLIVHSGAWLMNPYPSSDTSTESLIVNIAGDLVVESGGLIDATGRGYGSDTTYPGAIPPEQDAGGSHLGYGGGPAGSTYGSVTRPQEAGGGGSIHHYYFDLPGMHGGGAVRLTVGGDLQCDGEIRANGGASSDQNGGAGGSIWISVAGDASGQGAVLSKGGARRGGGGAVALEYGGTLTLPTVALDTSGADGYYSGGAGTVFLKVPDSTFGDLIVDNKGTDGPSTALPGLGSGIAQTGSSGVTLVTDKSSIPAYFVGHWVEASDSGGTIKGTWQVVAIDGSTLTFADGATVAEGDSWQGVYRFDSLTIRGSGTSVELRPDPVCYSLLRGRFNRRRRCHVLPQSTSPACSR